MTTKYTPPQPVHHEMHIGKCVGYFSAEQLNEAYAAGLKDAAKSNEQFIVALPKNAADVRSFMHGNCEAEQYANEDGTPSDDDRYRLTAHDFLTAVDEWADFLNAPDADQPVQMEPRAANAQPHKELTRDLIRDVFVQCGFEIEAGGSDLPTYIYSAAYALLVMQSLAHKADTAYLRKQAESLRPLTIEQKLNGFKEAP